MKKIEKFKKYLELKNQLHKYGYMRVDKDENLFIETLGGEKITHLAYQHSSRHNPHWYFDYVGKLVSISYATCGYTEICQIGKPQQKCVDDKTYSPNKCAVVFAELFSLDGFAYVMSSSDLNLFLEATTEKGRYRKFSQRQQTLIKMSCTMKIKHFKLKETIDYFGEDKCQAAIDEYEEIINQLTRA